MTTSSWCKLGAFCLIHGLGVLLLRAAVCVQTRETGAVGNLRVERGLPKRGGDKGKKTLRNSKSFNSILFDLV